MVMMVVMALKASHETCAARWPPARSASAAISRNHLDLAGYYRVETANHQIFELYRDDAHHGCWVLDVCQD